MRYFEPIRRRGYNTPQSLQNGIIIFSSYRNAPGVVLVYPFIIAYPVATSGVPYPVDYRGTLRKGVRARGETSKTLGSVAGAVLPVLRLSAVLSFCLFCPSAHIVQKHVKWVFKTFCVGAIIPIGGYMAYIKKQHQQTLLQVRDLLQARQGTFTTEEMAQFTAFCDLLQLIEKENEAINKRTADYMEKYRATPEGYEKSKEARRRSAAKRRAREKAEKQANNDQ